MKSQFFRKQKNRAHKGIGKEVKACRLSATKTKTRQHNFWRLCCLVLFSCVSLGMPCLISQLNLDQLVQLSINLKKITLLHSLATS